MQTFTRKLLELDFKRKQAMLTKSELIRKIRHSIEEYQNDKFNLEDTIKNTIEIVLECGSPRYVAESLVLVQCAISATAKIQSESVHDEESESIINCMLEGFAAVYERILNFIVSEHNEKQLEG